MNFVPTLPRHLRPLAIALTLGLLASCGGGDSGTSSPTPTPTNAAPQFTSGGATTVTENFTGPVYTATASDPDGDKLSFTIAGGSDAARFSISGPALAFVSPPNFDLPRDADEDNVYQLSLRVSDGKGGFATLGLKVTVTNLREGIRVVRILSAGEEAADIARTNDPRELILAERGGGLYFVDGSSGAKTPVPGYTPIAGLELMAVGFGPDNAFFKGPIVMHKGPDSIGLFRPNVSSRIDRQLASGNTSGVRGSLYYDSTGRLFAAVGDNSQGIAQADDDFAQTGFGKVYFADPAAYTGASLRPIPIVRLGKGIRMPGGLGEVAGRLLLADQGGSSEQELSVFAFDEGPFNFGWPFYEGRTLLQAGGPTGLLAPRLVYPFGNGADSGTGVVAGRTYSGPISSISGSYVFGDRSGKIWSVPSTALVDGNSLTMSDIEDRTADFEPDSGSIDTLVAIVTDLTGKLYLLDADGELFRVEEE